MGVYVMAENPLDIQGLLIKPLESVYNRKKKLENGKISWGHHDA